MNSHTNILLARLRKQPRHGATPEEDAKTVQGEIQDAIKLLPSLNGLYDTYSHILGEVNNKTTQQALGLSKVLEFQTKVAEKTRALVKNLTQLEESNKTLNEGFGLTSEKTDILGASLRDLFKNQGIGSTKTFEYAKSLRTLTGGLFTATTVGTTYGKNLLRSRQILQNNIGVTAEAAEGFDLYAAGMGKSSIDMIGSMKAIGDSIEKSAIGKKLGLDSLSIQKDLTEEIGNLTSDLQMRYNKIPGSLELAVLKSKALGLSMRDLNSAGDNLLSIESSIGQELEYQLLSGKRLLTADKKSLTDAYRRATLEGNADKQAELMNQLLQDQGDILEKNMFARKKAAELLGMDEATLAKSIQKRKILVELGAKDLMNLTGDALTSELDKLANEVKGDPEREKLYADLLKATDTRTSVDITNDYLEQIKDNTLAMMQGNVGTIRGTVKGLLSDTNQKSLTNFTTSLNGLAGTLGKFMMPSAVITLISDPLKALATDIPIIGETLKVTLDKLEKIVTAYKTIQVNDTLIMPERGPILRPAKNDVIAAFRPNDVIDRTLGTGGGATIDYAKLASAIASAMSNVKVEATVKTDTLYAATKLNGPRRFGQA